MVVNLAVEHGPDALVLVRHRLRAAVDVDDGEAALAQADRPFDPQPFAVRAAVVQHVPHALEPRLVDEFPRIHADDADNSTHGCLA